MKGIVKLGVTLFLICSIAAGSLAFVADFTAGPIAAQARLEQEDALKKVAPAATEFREAGDNRWEATSSAGTIGEVLAVTAKGYGGPISLVVGIDAERKVTGVRVTRQSETPGLGTKVAEDGFLSAFVGKGMGQLKLRKDDAAHGAIDAVAAATISSRAVTDAVRLAVGER